MCKKDDLSGCLYFLLFLLGGLWLGALVVGLIWGIENRKEPSVEEYWNGMDTVYIDNNRFCHFEKEIEGNFTTRNNSPSKNDTCILCGNKWSKHTQTQYTQQEIEDAFTEPPLPY